MFSAFTAARKKYFEYYYVTDLHVLHMFSAFTAARKKDFELALLTYRSYICLVLLLLPERVFLNALASLTFRPTYV